MNFVSSSATNSFTAAVKSADDDSSPASLENFKPFYDNYNENFHSTFDFALGALRFSSY